MMGMASAVSGIVGGLSGIAGGIIGSGERKREQAREKRHCLNNLGINFGTSLY